MVHNFVCYLFCTAALLLNREPLLFGFRFNQEWGRLVKAGLFTPVPITSLARVYRACAMSQYTTGCNGGSGACASGGKR